MRERERETERGDGDRERDRERGRERERESNIYAGLLVTVPNVGGLCFFGPRLDE